MYNRIPGISSVLLCGRGNGLRYGEQKRLEDIWSSRDDVNSTVTRAFFVRLGWKTERNLQGFGCVLAKLGKTNDYVRLKKKQTFGRVLMEYFTNTSSISMYDVHSSGVQPCTREEINDNIITIPKGNRGWRGKSREWWRWCCRRGLTRLPWSIPTCVSRGRTRGIARAYDTLYMCTLHNYTERSKLVDMLRRNCQKSEGRKKAVEQLKKKCYKF